MQDIVGEASFQPPKKINIQTTQQAVASMHVGGVRRVEVPGEREELYWPRRREQRYAGLNK